VLLKKAESLAIALDARGHGLDDRRHVDLDRMLEMCRRDQWRVGDLDWSQKPRAMSRDDESAIVQYFTDMSAIERLASALFREQERRTDDPRLRDIFGSFVKDEVRHAQVAQMLADHYDVHHFRTYKTSRSLERFFPHFLDAVSYLSDDIANAYITAGELMLDIALLRSIDDFVHDEMSAQAMRLINRDESRHIAVDYHMVEHYASDAYDATLAARPAMSPWKKLKAWWTFANVLWHAKPFFRDVFFQPMERVDPSGKRLREAIRRFQLLGSKPGVQRRPFGRFVQMLQDLYQRRVWRALFGRMLARLAGVEPRFLERLNTDEQLTEAARMSFRSSRRMRSRRNDAQSLSAWMAKPMTEEATPSTLGIGSKRAKDPADDADEESSLGEELDDTPASPLRVMHAQAIGRTRIFVRLAFGLGVVGSVLAELAAALASAADGKADPSLFARAEALLTKFPWKISSVRPARRPSIPTRRGA
jgi:hypothetical protein